MQLIRLIEEVKIQEGRRLVPYFDHLGVPSIGYGTTYWDGKPITMNWKRITEEQALTMLYSKLVEAAVNASKSVNDFNSLCDIRQECLAEMAYQMGGAGLRKWKKTIVFINRKDWNSARSEMLDSGLYRDEKTRARAIKYSDMIYFGDDYENSDVNTRMERTG